MSEDATKKAVELLAGVPEGEWSIESHGDGEALYIGRSYGTPENPFGAMHGLNIVNLVEPAYQWPGVRDLIVSAPKLLREMADEVNGFRTAVWDRTLTEAARAAYTKMNQLGGSLAWVEMVSDLVKLSDDQRRENDRLQRELKTAMSYATEGFVPSARVKEVKKNLAEAERESDRWHAVVSRLRNHLNLPWDAVHNDVPELAHKALTEAEERGARWAILAAEHAGCQEGDCKNVIEKRVREICEEGRKGAFEAR